MRIKPTEQYYDAYTPEDFKVWELLFNRQKKLLEGRASSVYLKALGDIGFHAKAIPDFEQINYKLLPATGWKIVVAQELVPQETFFDLLSRKSFPATCWLRTLKELSYIEEPDMFHDVFGHIPLLIHPPYASFMETLGKLALKWHPIPEAINLLSRIYWFTIEFGLISESDEIQVYGAGILSSPGETQNALSQYPERHAFDIERILQTDYRKDVVQDIYFIISSWKQLYNSLSEIEKQLEISLLKEGQQHEDVL